MVDCKRDCPTFARVYIGIKRNSQRVNKKDEAERHANTFFRMRGLDHRPSSVDWLNFLQEGGGYDPRLRHMQFNIDILQNIYKKYYINYKGITGFVKEKTRATQGFHKIAGFAKALA
jgi:hypothetical protein